MPSDDHSPNVYDFPGGTIEFGEDIKEALKREIAEETGLKVDVGGVQYVYAFLSNPQRHQFQIIYKCKYVGGDIKLNPEEHDSHKWVTADEAHELPKIQFLNVFLKAI